MESNWLDNMDLEPILLSHLLEVTHSPFPSPPKSVVESNHDLPDPNSFDKDISGKISRMLVGKLPGEVGTNHVTNPMFFNQPHLFTKRG